VGGWYNHFPMGRGTKMGDEEIKLPSVDAVDTDLDTDLTISPAEAQSEVENVFLVLAAREPEVARRLLEGVEKAKQAKMSAESILGIFQSTMGKALNILKPF